MSSNVNRIFMTGSIKDFKFDNSGQDSSCNFILQQVAYYNTEQDSSRARISEYKVFIYKPNVLETLKSIKNVEGLEVFINGYVSSIEKRGNESYVAGIEFNDDKYLNVIVAQDVIFIGAKPDNMSQEQFKTQLHSINMCILLGNTGSEPEVRDTKDGELRIANISIATNMHYRYQNKKLESTTWHKVVVIASQNNLSGLIKVIENHINRGDKLFIIGTLQSRKRDDKNGNEKNSIQVVLQNNASNLSIINSKHGNRYEEDRQGAHNNNGRARYNSTNNRKQEDYSLEYDEEDNIPF